MRSERPQTDQAKRWTESGFRASWRTSRLRLEAADRTIADAFGQKTEAMARHYTREADLRKKMTGVVQRLDLAENKRRSKIVKPD